MSDKCWLAAVESKPARLAIELFTPWEETLPDDSSLSALTHQHVFDEGNLAGEKGTRLVMWITLAMMVAEIIAGWWFNSMALLTDGWHMSSHA
ncbi:MAG TPA: cation transporter, partial [Accumulibacter sp.]|nr:cation transporter [Accumulibacter sp.]